ncbi:MAG TPA: 2-amino-4-hydroxy-6-hydroxymethyldihydropteridine diphosphokinase [Planctomycetaceae bacterium]|nr:2-amino-4-hydroxy-6-hydroxymethyldihydropteridine diphosphokinase [Planctomycetaceae bacterium]
MARCFVGLGANQGKPSEMFERVRQSLNLLSGISLLSSSSSYLTQALGLGSNGDFHNAVVELQATISPFELLAELEAIETLLGRQRGMRWGPRIIDLDLLYFDDLCLASETLILPHPHAWYRRFVLEPMCEIAAEFLHPVYSLTQQQLLQRIDRRPFKLEILGNIPFSREIECLTLEFSELEIECVSAPDGRGALVVGRNAEPDAIVPVLNLEQLPRESEVDVLRSVLAACLGHCARID